MSATVDPKVSVSGSPSVAAGSGLFQTAKHPTTCVLHIAFKIAALVIFTFGPLVFGFGDFVFTFVCTTVMLAIDFWVVKNLSGRLLVGMKWENEVNEEGVNVWKYNSTTDENSINPTDKTVFWTALILWPILWSVLSFFYFIKLDWDWMTLTLMAAALGAANLFGYWNCSTESKRRLQQIASSTVFKAALARMASLFI